MLRVIVSLRDASADGDVGMKPEAARSVGPVPAYCGHDCQTRADS